MEDLPAIRPAMCAKASRKRTAVSLLSYHVWLELMRSASMKANPTSSPYGPLITGNGATVKGSVQTNGGDDPSTPSVFENVSGNSNMDQARITADFNEDIPIPTAPSWSSWTYQGSAPSSFTTGTRASPTRYAVTGNLGTFAVTAPAAGTTGYIEIIVTGNLSTGNGSNAGITIPPNVFASIWVNGDINFGNGTINSDSNSSQVASHLTVYGTGTSGVLTTSENDNDTFVASGNANEILSLYAPNYVAILNGTVNTVGSFVVRSFFISGGGNGGFHYDESLSRSGLISESQRSVRVSSKLLATSQPMMRPLRDSDSS